MLPWQVDYAPMDGSIPISTAWVRIQVTFKKNNKGHKLSEGYGDIWEELAVETGGQRIKPKYVLHTYEMLKEQVKNIVSSKC